jgi:hypothetical protein
MFTLQTIQEMSESHTPKYRPDLTIMPNYIFKDSNDLYYVIIESRDIRPFYIPLMYVGPLDNLQQYSAIVTSGTTSTKWFTFHNKCLLRINETDNSAVFHNGSKILLTKEPLIKVDITYPNDKLWLGMLKKKIKEIEAYRSTIKDMKITTGEKVELHRTTFQEIKTINTITSTFKQY